MAFFAEVRRHSDEGQKEPWSRIGGACTSQERAKTRCKAMLLSEPHNAHRLEFRTVVDDERGSIMEVCQPPHGARLKWIDARFMRD